MRDIRSKLGAVFQAVNSRVACPALVMLDMIDAMALKQSLLISHSDQDREICARRAHDLNGLRLWQASDDAHCSSNGLAHALRDAPAVLWIRENEIALKQ